MRKADRSYIEGKLERVAEKTGVKFFLYGNAIAVRANNLGAIDVYKEGTTAELRAFAEGLGVAVSRLKREKEFQDKLDAEKQG